MEYVQFQAPKRLPMRKEHVTLGHELQKDTGQTRAPVYNSLPKVGLVAAGLGAAGLLTLAISGNSQKNKK